MTSVIDRIEMKAAFAEAAEIVKSGTSVERSGQVLPLVPVTQLRQSLGLSWMEFAERYRTPVDTLVAWERETREPDAPAMALLNLIAADPEGVAKTLAEVQTLAAE